MVTLHQAQTLLGKRVVSRSSGVLGPIVKQGRAIAFISEPTFIIEMDNGNLETVRVSETQFDDSTIGRSVTTRTCGWIGCTTRIIELPDGWAHVDFDGTYIDHQPGPTTNDKEKDANPQ